MQFTVALAGLLSLLPLALAQSAEWGQCGGIGWSGPTSCVSGTTCTVVNSYYSQCLPGGSGSGGGGGGGTTPTSSASSPSSSSTAGLHAAAKAAGKLYFGTETDSMSAEWTDTTYMSILASTAGGTSMFGQLTPGNAMKWDTTEPSQGNFNFGPGDQVVAEAQKNGQIMRGHNCVWYNQLPSWVSNGGFSASQLTSVIQNHCSTEVAHYKGEVYAWDVINEPFNDDGTWRTDVFYNTLGTTYVNIGLQAAASADPAAKLYINEYNIEYAGAKATSLLNLAKSVLNAGVKLNGIGFQCHFIVGEVPTGMSTIMNQFTALGLEVAITELDIRMTLPSTSNLLAQQKTDYTTVIKQCVAVEGCVGATIWDFTDKYSWVPSTFSGQGAALPWDQNYQQKPAYAGIIAGF